MRTSLMVVLELMKPSWCPSPNVDSILRATQDLRREPNSDCNLRDHNIINNVMTTSSKSNGKDKVGLPGWGQKRTGLNLLPVWQKSVDWKVTSGGSGLGEDPGETTQAVDDFVWEHCDEGENGNGTDCRLPWRNRAQSSDYTRIL